MLIISFMSENFLTVCARSKLSAQQYGWPYVAIFNLVNIYSIK